jgi:RNA polymerase sigma-B factor
VSRLLRATLEHVRRELSGETGEEPDEQPAKPRSGRLLLRLPQTLHGELAAAAQRDGVALNTYIAGTLAAAIGWRDPDGELEPRPLRRNRLLLVNAIVITLAALTGIALLLIAWLG